MGERTGIQWCHHTANFWIGCERVSRACDFCYADVGSRRLAAQHGLKLWGGDRYITKTAAVNVVTWNKRAREASERRRVFCMSFGDLFEGGRTDLESIRRTIVWPLIEQCTSLDFLLLTKRPQNIRDMVPSDWLRDPRPNVWLGTTCEDQERADERLPHLLEVPAWVHFVSYEPALGAVDFKRYLRALDWIICGGESGPHARPFDVAWAKSTVDQCRKANVAPFIKQLGANPVAYSLGDVSRLPKLKDKHGGDWNEWPSDIPRVREFPRAI